MIFTPLERYFQELSNDISIISVALLVQMSKMCVQRLQRSQLVVGHWIIALCVNVDAVSHPAGETQYFSDNTVCLLFQTNFYIHL